MILSRKRILSQKIVVLYFRFNSAREESSLLGLYHNFSYILDTCSRKLFEEMRKVHGSSRRRMIFCFVPGLRKLGGTCFRSCFCLVVKRDGENKFLVRARKFWRNVERRDATNLVKLFFFFTANLGSAKIPSICENPSWNTNRVS